MTTPTRACSSCSAPIVIPHCPSPNCTWCRACYDRKVEEGKQR